MIDKSGEPKIDKWKREGCRYCVDMGCGWWFVVLGFISRARVSWWVGEGVWLEGEGGRK